MILKQQLLGLFIWLILYISTPCCKADLPSGCQPLNEATFSTLNPTDIYEANSELQGIVPPKRIGDWRNDYAIPTQHFAINQIKSTGMVPMRLMPYSAQLSNEGITYEAYTLDKWNKTDRSDEMLQQTPNKDGQPWEKVISVGTNMKQMTSAPDGNPKGAFEGRSGIQVGILESGDPTWTEFGDMYATFLFKGANGAEMEVPLVRGNALLPHKFTDANPVLAPYCLSSVNGKQATYPCPLERNAADRGSGFISGTCNAGTLTITLRATKAVSLSQVQWAANTQSGWPNDHGMTTCGSECVIDSTGRRVDVTIPGASGTMAFAINVIGAYIVPQDWVENPATTICSGKWHPLPPKQELVIEKTSQTKACSSEFCHTPSCLQNDAFQLIVELGEPVTGIEVLQFAIEAENEWGSPPAMLPCSDSRLNCQISGDMKTVTVTKTVAATSLNYAVNVIGRFVRPPGDWINSPYNYKCGEGPTTEPPVTGATTASPTGPTPTSDPGFCSSIPSLSECAVGHCKIHSCEASTSGFQNIRIILQLQTEISGIDQVQFAIKPSDEWEQGHPMVTCTPDKCSLQSDMKTLVYCSTIKTGAVKYAINVVGRFILPPSDWTTQPYQLQCGGRGTELDTGKKFVFELNEPGDSLPSQTRKYVAYFSEDVTAIADGNGLSFEAADGGKFTGLMQLGYLGSGPRGDTSGSSFLDPYAGVYSYKPETTYCAMNGKGYINFDWKKHDANGPTTQGNLLMVTMPHHEPLLKDQGTLLDTPFVFKGFASNYWLLEEDLPESSMEPDAAAVQRIRDNPERLQNVLAGLERDATEQTMLEGCGRGGSYWVGKDIQMVARAASISRAFNTNHYIDLDDQLKECLERWLRVNDNLPDGDKFRYDTVYGGLLLRSSPEGEPINPAGNFGFPLYSDHHFHLGYFVYTLGYYAKYHPQWAQAHKERILLIARDVGNPSFRDKFFPIVRHKDFYLGISWATGVVGGMRQAESSTEAINCYHGLAALGLALGDENMEKIGQLMLATEIRSVREYYHVRAHNRHLFPDYLKTYGAIGQFAEDAIFYYTLNWPCDPNWFPMRHACLVGIQIIPIMSCSGLFMDQEWAAAVKNVCEWANDPTLAPGAGDVEDGILRPVSIGWGAFCHAARSKFDSTTQQEAADFVKGLGPKDLVSGTGVASTLIFIYEST